MTQHVSISDADGQQIVGFARATVEAALLGKPIPKLSKALAEMAVYGLFVTLKRGETLRACLGRFGGTHPLGQLLPQISVDTTANDTRFPVISPDEVHALDVEVSIMYAPVVLQETGKARAKAITIGRHGLVISHPEGRGLLLPQVATEQGWDVPTFLQGVCRKAGLPDDSWASEATELMTFQAQVFHDLPPQPEFQATDVTPLEMRFLADIVVAVRDGGSVHRELLTESLTRKHPDRIGLMVQTSGGQWGGHVMAEGQASLFEVAKKLGKSLRESSQTLGEVVLQASLLWQPITLLPPGFPHRHQALQGRALVAWNGDRWGLYIVGSKTAGGDGVYAALQAVDVSVAQWRQSPRTIPLVAFSVRRFPPAELEQGARDIVARLQELEDNDTPEGDPAPQTAVPHSAAGVAQQAAAALPTPAAAAAAAPVAAAVIAGAATAAAISQTVAKTASPEPVAQPDVGVAHTVHAASDESNAALDVEDEVIAEVPATEVPVDTSLFESEPAVDESPVDAFAEHEPIAEEAASVAEPEPDWPLVDDADATATLTDGSLFETEPVEAVADQLAETEAFQLMPEADEEAVPTFDLEAPVSGGSGGSSTLAETKAFRMDDGDAAESVSEIISADESTADLGFTVSLTDEANEQAIAAAGSLAETEAFRLDDEPPVRAPSEPVLAEPDLEDTVPIRLDEEQAPWGADADEEIAAEVEVEEMVAGDAPDRNADDSGQTLWPTERDEVWPVAESAGAFTPPPLPFDDAPLPPLDAVVPPPIPVSEAAATELAPTQDADLVPEVAEDIESAWPFDTTHDVAEADSPELPFLEEEAAAEIAMPPAVPSVPPVSAAKPPPRAKTPDPEEEAANFLDLPEPAPARKPTAEKPAAGVPELLTPVAADDEEPSAAWLTAETEEETAAAAWIDDASEEMPGAEVAEFPFDDAPALATPVPVPLPSFSDEDDEVIEAVVVEDDESANGETEVVEIEEAEEEATFPMAALSDEDAPPVRGRSTFGSLNLGDEEVGGRAPVRLSGDLEEDEAEVVEADVDEEPSTPKKGWSLFSSLGSLFGRKSKAGGKPAAGKSAAKPDAADADDPPFVMEEADEVEEADDLPPVPPRRGAVKQPPAVAPERAEPVFEGLFDAEPETVGSESASELPTSAFASANSGEMEAFNFLSDEDELPPPAPVSPKSAGSKPSLPATPMPAAARPVPAPIPSVPPSPAPVARTPADVVETANEAWGNAVENAGNALGSMVIPTGVSGVFEEPLAPPPPPRPAKAPVVATAVPVPPAGAGPNTPATKPVLAKAIPVAPRPASTPPTSGSPSEAGSAATAPPVVLAKPVILQPNKPTPGAPTATATPVQRVQSALGTPAAASGGPAVSAGVRPPSRAGVFYPPTAEAIAAMTAKFLKLGKGTPGPMRAVMLPHAGWEYCGSVIGQTLSHVDVPKTVIILSPKHTPLGPPWSVSAATSWAYPGGAVPVATDLRDTLLRHLPNIACEDEAHKLEHGIEVLVPFLHRKNPHVRILPIVLGPTSYAQTESLARALLGVLQEAGEPVLFVVSSDLNHFAAEAENRRRDYLALNAMQTGRPDQLYDVIVRNDVSMCGVIPAVVTLRVLHMQGNPPRPELVDYANSAAVSGDYNRVVGYGGMTIA